jgi:transcriptional regulator with XRE-family HTH domain
MDPDNDLGEYLRARREAVAPQEVGLVVSSRARRVRGLRREEVAQLASISVEYYLRLEQGRERHPSSQVITALARALALDGASENFLRMLVEQRSPRPLITATVATLGRFIDTLRHPALAHDRVLEVVVINEAARALLPDVTTGVNLMRWAFLEPASRKLYVNWDELTQRLVSYLRAQAAVPSTDARLPGLVEELSTASTRFAELWRKHDVRTASAGINNLNHPRLGRIDIFFERLVYAGSTDPVILIYQAEAGSPSEAALARLLDNP